MSYINFSYLNIIIHERPHFGWTYLLPFLNGHHICIVPKNWWVSLIFDFWWSYIFRNNNVSVLVHCSTTFSIQSSCPKLDKILAHDKWSIYFRPSPSPARKQLQMCCWLCVVLVLVCLWVNGKCHPILRCRRCPFRCTRLEYNWK